MRRPDLRIPRRPCQTVIWGGRIHRDRWVGSTHDLRMEAIERHFAELERRRTAHAQRVLSTLGLNARDVAARLERTQAAIDAVGKTAAAMFATHREATLSLGAAERKRQERVAAAMGAVGASLRRGLHAPDDDEAGQ